MRSKTKGFVSVLAVLAMGAMGCGGVTIDPGDGGGGDSGQDQASPDAKPDSPLPPVGCGGMCGSGEICIHPCCGGAPPMCTPPLDDAGTCPPGSHWGQCLYGGSGDGCVEDPCTPPPPYCAPPPPSGQCMPQNGSDCYEMCA